MTWQAAPAPDGQGARAARSDRAEADFVMLVQAVGIYLDAHPELELRASANFANIIRPDILELLGLPKVACSPSLSAIVKALRVMRKRSFIL